nr:ribonuclease H-like domain-containing protein [Tanacetum cinerariifolium]
MIIRAQVGTIKPNPHFHGLTSSLSPFSKSPSVALSNPHWRDALVDEYITLIKNGTWILISKPPNVNVVRSMWLCKHKFCVDGSLNRYIYLVQTFWDQPVKFDRLPSIQALKVRYDQDKSTTRWKLVQSCLQSIYVNFVDIKAQLGRFMWTLQVYAGVSGRVIVGVMGMVEKEQERGDEGWD